MSSVGYPYRMSGPGPSGITTGTLVRSTPAVQVFSTYEYAGKTLVRGSEFSIKGEYGARFRFHRYVVLEDGREWIDAFGGPKDVTMWRSFRPARIARITRLRPSEPSLRALRVHRDARPRCRS
jgi:hypothetical protein